MLIDEARVLRNDDDPIMAMLQRMTAGSPTEPVRLQQGVYQIGHFGSSSFLRNSYEHYPSLGEHGSYGVCDSVENLLAVVTELANPDRQFVVTLTKVTREEQSPEGGWRWHKWGEYIGAFDPQREYLYDEVGIDAVYVYQIYEKLEKPQ